MESAYFSLTYDTNESSDFDAVINAGASQGFVVHALTLNWQPHSMSSSSDELPDIVVARFTSTASGGTAGAIFNHTAGATPAASALLSPTTLGSGRINGPVFWPGPADYTGSVWFMHGGTFTADQFDPIELGAGESLWVRASHSISATIHFSEHLHP